MQVHDVMSNPVISIRPHVTVETAAALLASHGFAAAPVVDAEGRLHGLVSEATLLRARDPAAEVRTCLTPRPIVVAPDVELAVLAELMLTSRARTVPVVEAGRLVGIVTPRDVLRAIARGADAPPRPALVP